MSAEFLAKHGYEPVAPISGDASPRRYMRVRKNGRSAVLMDCSNELTDRPGMAEFIRICTFLEKNGVRVPEMYEGDEAAKYLILEDFGDVSFGKALKDGLAEAKALYTQAAELLEQLRALNVPANLELPLYCATRVHQFHEDIIHWFLPHGAGIAETPDILAGYHAAWDEIEAGLPAAPKRFVHMDYHLENIMFLPDKKGGFSCGLIDFQDASLGHGAYDLVNLLEDARVSVPQDIQKALLAGFDEEFMAYYRVLGTQFHCRVIGLFTRLAVRDGRPEYLVHIPRLAAYIDDALHHPVLMPLKAFFSDLGLDFKEVVALNAPSES